jgi:hypothetical protein
VQSKLSPPVAQRKQLHSPSSVLQQRATNECSRCNEDTVPGPEGNEGWISPNSYCHSANGNQTSRLITKEPSSHIFYSSGAGAKGVSTTVNDGSNTGESSPESSSDISWHPTSSSSSTYPSPSQLPSQKKTILVSAKIMKTKKTTNRGSRTTKRTTSQTLTKKQREALLKAQEKAEDKEYNRQQALIAVERRHQVVAERLSSKQWKQARKEEQKKRRSIQLKLHKAPNSTEEERFKKLNEDPSVKIVSETQIKCLGCGTEFVLNKETDYAKSNWIKHRDGTRHPTSGPRWGGCLAAQWIRANSDDGANRCDEDGFPYWTTQAAADECWRKAEVARQKEAEKKKRENLLRNGDEMLTSNVKKRKIGTFTDGIQCRSEDDSRKKLKRNA